MSQEMEELKQRVARQTVNRADVMRMQNEKYMLGSQVTYTYDFGILFVCAQVKAGGGAAVGDVST